VSQLEIPILINQTEPVEMELIRIDAETNHNETILLKRGELKGLLNKARKATKKKTVDPADPLTLRYPVKKRGIYLLKKVLDQSKLEVRPRTSNAVVTICPQARVHSAAGKRCRSDTSNVALEVEGVPPLYVKYRLVVDDQPRGGSEFQNLQPDDYLSPLSRMTSQALVRSDRGDVSWAQSRKVSVPLNEVLATGSRWEYAVEEVQDGLGNLVSFNNVDDEDRPKTRTPGTRQSFEVYERPKVYLQGCNPQKPLRVAKGNKARLPIKYASTGKKPVQGQHTIEYLFTPEADIVADGQHSTNAEVVKQTMRTTREQPLITKAGLYTIKTVSTEFCSGEVLEPTSCLLQNPPEPELSLTSEDIVGGCAGNPIGLRVSLDFIGTPPFHVVYREQQKGHKDQIHQHQVGSLRGTIDLRPDDRRPEPAGHYTYTFETISDAVYQGKPLDNLILQQDVRPPASAHFMEGDRPKQACIDDYVDFDVLLMGDGPFKLEYEVVHNGKRNKRTIETDEQHYTIKTDKLKSGGEYTVALISITDGNNCKDFLKDKEARVQVRHERPKAYFGHIEGKQSVMALEGRKVDLPIRLTGAGPWTLEYKNIDTDKALKIDVLSANSILGVVEQGTYKLQAVRDSVCPGFIEDKASAFNVGWIARPQISIPNSPSIMLQHGKYFKDAVCEGIDDSFDIALSGKKNLLCYS